MAYSAQGARGTEFECLRVYPSQVRALLVWKREKANIERARDPDDLGGDLKQYSCKDATSLARVTIQHSPYHTIVCTDSLLQMSASMSMPSWRFSRGCCVMLTVTVTWVTSSLVEGAVEIDMMCLD